MSESLSDGLLRPPKEPHMILHTGKKKVVIVGDIHGCADEFKLLLKKCQWRWGDIVVLAGDLVNKGPKSVEVIRLARTIRAYGVRGNHDEAALRSLCERRIAARNSQPLNDVKPKYAWTDELNLEEIEWFTDLPYTISLPAIGALVVHAGLVPGIPLSEQSPQDMTTMRNLVKVSSTGARTSPRPSSTTSAINGKSKMSSSEELYGVGMGAGKRKSGVPRRNSVGDWSGVEATEEGVAWAGAWKGPPHVFFGHDARRGLQRHKSATGLDTGCCYGGQLTAAMFPARMLMFVEAKEVYAQPKFSAADGGGGAAAGAVVAAAAAVQDYRSGTEGAGGGGGGSSQHSVMYRDAMPVDVKASKSPACCVVM